MKFTHLFSSPLLFIRKNTSEVLIPSTDLCEAEKSSSSTTTTTIIIIMIIIMMAFSYHVSIWGEGSMIQSSPALFFF